MGNSFMINWNLLTSSIPLLVRGLYVSMQITCFSFAIGSVLGTCIGFALLTKNKWIYYPALWYTMILRGTPMLVQILCFFYVLPQLGISLSAFWTAVISIGLNSSAYISTMVRAGIASVDKGQYLAGKALGLSRIQTLRYIVLPQALRISLPMLGDEIVTLIKDSSLASVIGVTELAKEGSLIISRTYDAISTYAAVALMYFIITSLISYATRYVEKRLDYHAGH